ncbi:MAG: glycoside hydrolase family 97 protein [Bacteroidales bacterium]|nr:glycoside hydrolase family 97 protein [Bacteroidales bacterium]
MKNNLLVLVLLCAAACQQNPFVTVSPDGSLAIILDNSKIRVEKNSAVVIADTEISMATDCGDYIPSPDPLKVRHTKKKTTLRPIMYHASQIEDCYNETKLVYEDFDLILRAYDEAVAYRFVSKSRKPFKVISEKADFAFHEGALGHIPYVLARGSFERQFNNSFENQYVHIPLCEWDSARLAFLPITVESEGYTVCLTESDLLNFPGLMFSNVDGNTTLESIHATYPAAVKQGGHNNIEGKVTDRKPYIAECGGKEQFPWRIVAVADNPAGLIGSDIVYKLATPADKSVDWSWVKPGKVAWDWWNDWNLKGVDFEAGINTETYKFYIDFAAEHGLEYVILDEGWSTVGTADLYDIIPEIDLPELIRHADSKGVGLILWGGYWAFQNDMDGLMKHYADMGIKGFKIDFMNRDDQPMVNFYCDAAEVAAKYHLILDFHGAFKPCGLQRTYPNVLNFEGVYGEEMQKFYDISRDQMDNDCTIPFARMVAGSLDYTPGAMRNSTYESFRPVSHEPMSQGTRCHQLALYPIFEAPLLMCCDSPTNYMEELECFEYMAGIPTVWDETIGVDGVISDYAVIARRRGTTWYVGAITDWSARDIDIDFGFLPEGTYRMVSYADGPDADMNAEDFTKSSSTLSSGDVLPVHLAPGGGWAAKLEMM